jgi:hypothetical protein
MDQFGAGLISFLTAITVTLVTMTQSQQARAALGAGAASVQSDAVALNMVVKSTKSKILHQNSAPTTVYEMSNGGLTVREYTRPDGTVYGVAWQGMNHPDLQPLLGSYFKDFSLAHQSKNRRKGPHRHGSIKGNDIVVEKSGHMRAVSGRAYVPSLLPQGVSADDIQ